MRSTLLTRFCTAGFLVATPFLIGADGCDMGQVNVGTRIEPDGRISRQITQVRDQSLPPEALAVPKKYPPSTQPSDYPLRPEWAARWAASQPALVAQEKGPLEFAAIGTFASAADIPRNYHIVDWPLENRCSTNRINHTFTDYSLFGIDDWNETISETVLIYEYVETIDEMLRSMLPALEGTLDEVFRKDYDFTELKSWLRDQAATAARRYALLRYQIACEPGGKEDSPESIRRYKDIATAAGLNIPSDDKGEVDGERAAAAAREFFQNLFETRVRSKATGQHLTADEAKQLARRLQLDFPPSSQPSTATQPGPENQPAASAATSADTQPTKGDPAPWDSAWQEIFQKQFERINGKRLEDAALRWGALTGGANRAGPVQFFDPYSPGSRKFVYTIECAGPVFETNGQFAGGNTVRWEFDSSSLWPNGYRMHVAAIRWNRDAEKKLFGHPVLPGIEAVLQLKETIGDRQPVKDAIKLAVEQGSLDPLRKLAAGDNDDAKASQEILKLATRPAP